MNKFLTLVLFLAAACGIQQVNAQCIPTAAATVAGTADVTVNSSFSFTGVSTGSVIELISSGPNDVFSFDLCANEANGWADGSSDSNLSVLDMNDATATALANIDDGCTNGAGPNFWGPSAGTWSPGAAGTFYLYLTEWNYYDPAYDNPCIADGVNSYDINISIVAPGPCEAGTYSGDNPMEVCPSTLGVFEVGTATADGGFAMGFSDAAGGTGGLAGGFVITNIASAPYTFDADLNGVLSANSLAPLDGTWELTFYAFDAAGAPCDSTAVIPVNFNATDVPCTDTPVEDVKELSSLDITPNPSNGVFTMNLGLNSAQEVNVQIIDVAGKVITSRQRTGSNVQFDFDLSNLPVGMYFAKINVNGETTTEKIVIR